MAVREEVECHQPSALMHPVLSIQQVLGPLLMFIIGSIDSTLDVIKGKPLPNPQPISMEAASLCDISSIELAQGIY